MFLPNPLMRQSCKI